MYFKLLPEHIKEAIIKLTTDEEFQNRFSTDEELNRIDEMKINHSEEYQLLLTILNQKHIFKDIEMPYITPVMWYFLWVIKSPFTQIKIKPTKIDIDIFMYILYNGVGNCNINDIIMASENFCQNTLNISFEEAENYINMLIGLAFRPLKLFPQSSSSSQLMFDGDWITSLISRVHVVTGLSPQDIINKTSLSSCCYYYAQYCRSQGDQNIHRRTDEEILILQMERSVDLICERLIELNIFPKEDKLKYRTIMLTPPQDKHK